MEMVQERSSSDKFVEVVKADIETVGAGIKRQMLGYGPDIMICPIWFETSALCLEAGVLLDTFSPAPAGFLGDSA